MKEHFLLTWYETDGEIHFMILPMFDYYNTNKIVSKIIDKNKKYTWDYIHNIMSDIKKRSLKTSWIKTTWSKVYSSEDWNFSEFNIKKVISLPDFKIKN